MPSTNHRGHTLTWEEHSQGDTTFIFINGYSANRSIWHREVAHMAPYGRCVTLDLPGHYPAQVPPDYRELTQEMLIDLELHAIREIANGQPVTLIGHSTGGMVALAMASLYPELVQRVVAIAPVVWGPLSGFLGLYQRQMYLLGGYGFYWLNYRATQRSLPYIKWGIGQFYSGDAAAYRRNPIAKAAVEHWHADYQRSSIRNFAILLKLLALCDIRPLMAQIRCPLLIIAGHRDPVVPIQQAHWLHAQVAGSQLLEVPKAGHLPHWEAASMVDAAITEWMS
ncbi:alpha/beta fold hydrolase [Candidatus Oscillochloris fontis]|uniref:alpha/beta fold hydrolase n=1 Tax=Candidatus Oscillochloris fontis TaxID=2496868 RepID=UPI00101D1926|nr:alpha/beta hydrolase [Candidatus Oscillochloris fontis]